LADFTAKVRRGYFDGAAHLVEARAHAGADAVGQGVFANRDALASGQTRRGLWVCRFINIIRS
jgi:hypothetical protein